jgi:Fur family zinc uptake transcriptional regulator
MDRRNKGPEPSPEWIAQKLAEAEAWCLSRGTRLTALRREVLELLLRKGSAKAYELQDEMRALHERVAPTTVYRALEFLMANHLAHRVDSLSSFIACHGEHTDHHPLLLVCSVCEEASELTDTHAADALVGRLRSADTGFRETGIEVKGVCGTCSSQGRAA